MKSETKKCQNCQKDFTIESEDFSFYKKINVPAPIFCPDCRSQRRLLWRNERSLYERKDSLNGTKIISQYDQSVSFPVLNWENFYSDDLQVPEVDYDDNRSFFEQFAELYLRTPKLSLLTDLDSIKNNSLYQNASSRNKDCYLVFASGDNENCSYGTSLDYCKEVMDGYYVRDSSICYECIDCYSSYNLILSQNCRECLDSSLLFDCKNCQNCFGCTGLRNKNYYIFNKSYGREEYFKNLPIINEAVIKIFERLKLKQPRKFAHVREAKTCTGDMIMDSKNIKQSFGVYRSKDCSYCSKLVQGKDCFDISDWGDPAERCYECITIGKNVYNCFFSNNCWPACTDTYYSDSCSSCRNIFGCVGLRNEEYRILNKKYSKSDYKILKAKIIAQMKKDKEYGEFFPTKLSPFCYNETIAQEHFPLIKEEALSKGYRWKEEKERNYTIDIKNKDIPDDIEEVEDDIIKKVIECEHHNKDCNEQCTSAFKIIKSELDFYRKMKLPLPRFCPNCRHYQRLKQRNPLKLWKRTCMQEGCDTQFETTYSSKRPEIVYCEKCYQDAIL